MTSLPIEPHPIPPRSLQVYSYHDSLCYYAYNIVLLNDLCLCQPFAGFHVALFFTPLGFLLNIDPWDWASGLVGKVFITAQSGQPKFHHSETLGKQDALVCAWNTVSELQVG